MQNISETRVQALERQCIVKVTADMRCPKSQSHGKYLMSGWWCTLYADINAYMALKDCYMCGSCVVKRLWEYSILYKASLVGLNCRINSISVTLDGSWKI